MVAYFFNSRITPLSSLRAGQESDYPSDKERKISDRKLFLTPPLGLRYKNGGR
jgi:hypothetical protein